MPTADEHARTERLRELRQEIASLERRRPEKLRRRVRPAAAGAGLEANSPSDAAPAVAGHVCPTVEDEGGVVSTGCEALDALLARRGLERGSLVEWLGTGRGGGAGELAWRAACAAARAGGGLVVIDRQRRFYPPAALAWGVDPRRLAVVRVENDEDELWVVDQALRSPAVAAVWLQRDELSPRDFRRWQLAAERGGTLGLLVRPAHVQGQPTWADVRWQVRPVGSGEEEGGTGGGERSGERAKEQRREVGGQRGGLSGGQGGGGSRRVWRLRVELVRCRGGVAGGYVDLELDDVSGALRAVHGGERLLGSTRQREPADSNQLNAV